MKSLGHCWVRALSDDCRAVRRGTECRRYLSQGTNQMLVGGFFFMCRRTDYDPLTQNNWQLVSQYVLSAAGSHDMFCLERVKRSLLLREKLVEISLLDNKCLSKTSPTSNIPVLLKILFPCQDISHLNSESTLANHPAAALPPGQILLLNLVSWRDPSIGIVKWMISCPSSQLEWQCVAVAVGVGPVR